MVKSLARGLTVALLTTASSVSYAQSAVGVAASEAGAEAGSGEILVTARRFTESLQSTPISVSVLTAQDIAQRGVESVSDIATQTPNVNFTSSFGPGGGFLTVRGQTQERFSSPPVAVVVDGVLQILPAQFNVDEFDLEQIEVLKGPQGAIYGRNAIAGAINITTRKPGNDFVAHAMAGAARGEEYKAKLSVSGPVVQDKLFLLGGLSWKDRRGQVQNITTGTYSDKYKDFSQRVRLIATPTDDLELDIKYTHSKTHGNDPNFVESSTGRPNDNDDPLNVDIAGYGIRNLNDVSGKLSYDLGPVSLIGTLAYVEHKERLRLDLDSTAFPVTDARQLQNDKGFSQELRLVSNAEGPAHFVVGGYHARSRAILRRQIFADPFFFGLSPVPIGPVAPFGDNANRYRRDVWAVFAQLGYDITPELRFDLDVRYDHEKVRLLSTDFLLPVLPTSDKTDFNKLQPKGTLTYRPDADLTVYASVGQGFRAGDFNPGLRSFGNNIIKAEVATTYEVGVKTRWLDRRLTINAAVFQSDLKNAQFRLFDQATLANIGVNTDKSRQRGLEIDANLRAADNLSINAAIGYIDAEVLRFTAPAGYTGAQPARGDRPLRAPDFTANLGFNLTAPVSDALELFLRPQYRYTGAYYWDPANAYKRKAQNMLNIRAGVQSADDRWSITGYVENVLNEKITVDYQPASVTGGTLLNGADTYFPPVGSVYGIEVTFRF
ncbi:TonB-dependent receptor [Sphingomonas sp. Root1294]|nr:TonB-dependent receptor [Sphingomonas sp. Root1294]